MTLEKSPVWIENTKKYGRPFYMYPFWFWTEAKSGFNSCSLLSLPSARDIQACKVWNEGSQNKWTDYSPPYLEDHSALQIKPEKPEKPEKPTQEESSTWTYLFVGSTAAALLYLAYKIKVKRNRFD